MVLHKDNCPVQKERTTVLAALALAGLFYPLQAQASEPWSIVVVPDTQHYVDQSENFDDLVTQMTWIADNIETYQVKLITQLGDVVQHGSSTTEWTRAQNAYEIIHGLVPYSVCIGDHDYTSDEIRSSGASQFVSRFGAARYQGFPWYGGSSPDQKSHYQLFSAGGREFLHLNLEWEIPGRPSDPSTPMGWAKQVLDTHPNTPTIISTHSYLWDEPGEEGRTNGLEEDDGNGNTGEMVWNELIANSPQVFMVLNGNFHKSGVQYDPDTPMALSTDGEYHQVSTNLLGLPVYEMLSDYQDYPNGGDGWLRLIQFHPGGGANGLDRISVSTYSPTHDAFQPDVRSQFHFDLSFAQRFDNIPDPLELDRTTVTSGVDTYVWQSAGSTNYGSSTILRIDTADNGPQQGLLRFTIDFGGTIPEGAEIIRALLKIQITESGDGFKLHRMLRSWTESGVTWNSLVNGISTDGVEAAAIPNMTTLQHLSEAETPSYSLFDVTPAVRSWADGQPNYGWAIMPQGTDKLLLRSFEGSSLRPQLVIDYRLPNLQRVTVTSGVDAYIWKGQPQTNFGNVDRIRIDVSDGTASDGSIQPMQGLIKFSIPFGTGPGQIPPGSDIRNAQLRLRVTDSGDGFRLHRLRVSWSESTVTWSSMSNGINDDGVEAMDDPDVISAAYIDEHGTAQYHSFDVTSSVAAWANGQANHGWVLLPLGSDKLLIESLEGTTLKPELVIDYVAP